MISEFSFNKSSGGAVSNTVMNWNVWMTLGILLIQCISVAGFWCMTVHLSHLCPSWVDGGCVGALVSAVDQAQFPSAPVMAV